MREIYFLERNKPFSVSKVQEKYSQAFSGSRRHPFQHISVGRNRRKYEDDKGYRTHLEIVRILRCALTLLQTLKEHAIVAYNKLADESRRIRRIM